jgi:hypothetical protein
LKAAGWAGPSLTEDGTEKLYEVSRGVPRNIVKVCNLAFEMASLMGKQVDDSVVAEAALSTLYEPEEDEENEA